jgi:peptidoglycan hydrolase-like protein with peptidoglycan-binding domain
MVAAVALGLLTAACGTDTRERTTGGAAAGAATGAGVGALGGPPGALAGAAIGGGIGAVTGATTEPSTLNLGEPPWSNPQARVPGVDMNGSRSGSGMAGRSDPRVRQLQQALNDRGYNAGPVDGVWGPQTRSGVRDWQRANNQTATGRPSDQMLSELNVSGSGSMAGSSGSMGGSSGNMGSRSGDRATGSDMRSMGTMGGGSQGLSRPDPNAPRPAAPSNNPLNDPIGSGSPTSPFLNNNQNSNEGGGTGGTGGSGGSGSTR